MSYFCKMCRYENEKTVPCAICLRRTDFFEPKQSSPSPPADVCSKCGHDKHKGRCAVMDDGIHPCPCNTPAEPPKTPPEMPEVDPNPPNQAGLAGKGVPWVMGNCIKFTQELGKKKAMSCVGCTIPGCREKGSRSRNRPRM